MGALGQDSLGLLGGGGGGGGLAQGPLACLAWGNEQSFSSIGPLAAQLLVSLCCHVLSGAVVWGCHRVPPPSSGSPGHVCQGSVLSGKRRKALGSVGPFCQEVGILGLAKSTAPCQ